MYLNVFPIEKWVFSSQLCDRFPEGIYPKCSMYGLFTYMKRWKMAIGKKLPCHGASGYVEITSRVGVSAAGSGMTFGLECCTLA